MNPPYYIIRIALFYLSAIFLLPGFVFSQSKNPLHLIEGSDDIRLDGKTGNYIVRGNVRLVQDGTKMYCDSAYYNAKKQIVRAYGNVHINKNDSLNLYCDSLYYETLTEFAKLWGRVRIRDLEYKLTTDSLDFYGKEDKGVYRNRGEITSIVTPEKLTSKVGYFYTATNNFFFRGDVVYTKEDYVITTDTLKYDGNKKRAHFFGPTTITSTDGIMYCEKGWYDMAKEEGVFQYNAYIDRPKEYIEADSLYYNGLIGKYIAKGNVLLRDTTNAIEFTGDYAKSLQEERFGFITGHALAKQYDEKNDTLYIHADTLYNFLDSLNESRLMLAYYGVKLFKTDMQGVCDSLSYDKALGEMNMYVNPVLWAKNAQLSGDTVTVFQQNNDIKKAKVRLNALVVTEVDTGKFYNQIASKSLIAYFDSTQIRRVDMEGNAKTVYFMEDEKDEDTVVAVERSGMNRIYASDISMYFDGGDIQAATYREAPDGKMYPMDQIKESEQKVEQFKWDNSRRPISWQTMVLLPEEFEVWKVTEEKKQYLRQLKPILADESHNDLVLFDEWIIYYTHQNNHHFFDSLIPFLRDSLYVTVDDLIEQHNVLNGCISSLTTQAKLMQRYLLQSADFELAADSIITTKKIVELKKSLEYTTFEIAVLDSFRLLINSDLNKLHDFVDTTYYFMQPVKKVANGTKTQAVSSSSENEEGDTLQTTLQQSEFYIDSLILDQDSTEMKAVIQVNPTLHPVGELLERCEALSNAIGLSGDNLYKELISLEQLMLELRNLNRYLILHLNQLALNRKRDANKIAESPRISQQE